MKYYLILGLSQNGYFTATIVAKNKFKAIEEARGYCPHKNYIPVLVKRISKKYFNLIASINKKDETKTVLDELVGR